MARVKENLNFILLCTACNYVSKSSSALTKGLFFYGVIIADLQADCCEFNVNNGQQFKTLSPTANL